MGFLSVVHSDRGIKKNTNQDSVLIKEACRKCYLSVSEGNSGVRQNVGRAEDYDYSG